MGTRAMRLRASASGVGHGLAVAATVGVAVGVVVRVAVEVGASVAVKVGVAEGTAVCVRTADATTAAAVGLAAVALSHALQTKPTPKMKRKWLSSLRRSIFFNTSVAWLKYS